MYFGNGILGRFAKLFVFFLFTHDRSLGQIELLIFEVCSPQGTLAPMGQTASCATRSRICCIAYPDLAMHVDKFVPTDEREGLDAETLFVGIRAWNRHQRIVLYASKTRKCYSVTEFIVCGVCRQWLSL